MNDLARLAAVRADLRDHLLAHSVKTGNFTLKSGRTSSWFIDAKQTACRPDGIALIAEAACLLLTEWLAAGALSAARQSAGPALAARRLDAIGGLTMGADPIAFGVAATAPQHGLSLRSFSVRKEDKDHGIEGRIAGALSAGDHVVVTEDVATRGTSAMAAVEAVRAVGAHPAMLMPVVDRGGTTAALAAAAGVDYLPLLTAVDLGFSYEP